MQYHFFWRGNLRQVFSCMIPAIVLTAMILVTAYPTFAKTGTDAGKELYFGFINNLEGIKRQDAQLAVEYHFNRHIQKIFPAYTSEFVVLSNLADAERKIKKGALHGIATDVTDFLTLRKLVDITPIFISSRVSEPLESYVLIAKRGMTMSGLAELPKRRFLMGQLTSHKIGAMWLDTVLWEKGYPESDQFFTASTFSSKISRIVLPVFFGKAEACLIPESAFATMVELNPQIGAALEIILRSPGIVKSVNSATSLLDQEKLDKFAREGINMNDTADGRQLQLIFHVKKNFIFKPEYIREAENIFNIYHEHTDNEN